jgi:hypothetical protein
MSSGKVVQSPERRSERACSWIRVGQFVEEAWRAWRRVSWILGGVFVRTEFLSVEKRRWVRLGFGLGNWRLEVDWGRQNQMCILRDMALLNQDTIYLRPQLGILS